MYLTLQITNPDAPRNLYLASNLSFYFYKDVFLPFLPVKHFKFKLNGVPFEVYRLGYDVTGEQLEILMEPVFRNNSQEAVFEEAASHDWTPCDYPE